MGGILVSGLVFFAVFLGIFAVNLILTDLFKEDQKNRKKEDTDLRAQMREHARASIDDTDLSDVMIASNPSNQYFSIVDLLKKLNEIVQQSGVNADSKKILTWSTLSGALVSGLLFVLTKNGMVAALGFPAGAVIPVLFVLLRRKKRLDELNKQLPDALDLMARVLRAGQTITQAMNGVADEFSEPISSEFGICYEQQNLGLSLEDVMQNLVKRTGLMEVKILVMGILIQRQAGGNLAELLDKLSNVMRQRTKLLGKVQALTAEGRLQASFLCALPFCTWILMYIVNPGYALKLLLHPDLIYTTIGFMFLGMLWIRKIINFDY